MPASSRPYVALPLIWAAIILLLTLTPAVDMPLTPTWKLLSFDTAAHAAVFGLLAALCWFSARRQRRWPWLAHHAFSVVLLGCVLFGGLIEVLQQTMHQGRHGEWSDLLSDGLGAALALLGLAGLRRLRAGQVAVGLALFAFTTAANAQNIEPDTARARCLIKALASPKMHGRGYVQNGDKIAAEYLRKRLRELKLEPLTPNYTQPFALDVNTFPGTVKLVVTTAVNAGRYEPVIRFLSPGTDFIVAADAPPRLRHRYRLVQPDTLALTDATVRAAAQRVPPAGHPDEVLLLRQRDEKQLMKPENAALLARWEVDYPARIVLVDKLTASIGGEQARQARLEVLAARWPLLLHNLTRYKPEWASCGVLLQVDAQLQRNYPTQNLAAIIRGTTQPDSFLVVSAHYDHLGMMGKDVFFPGANDNASGVALLLELAAHYARPENRPACSVVFLLFGAEEAGLLGSQYFVQHPLVPLHHIKFLMNLDLLGTGEQGATVVNGRVHEAAYQRLVAINDARHYLPALAPRGRAANSDHYPFSEVGVPAFFLYTRGGSPAYHDVHDVPAALSLAGFRGAFSLVRDFLDALAK